MNINKSAFSLVELSIVLVILGLLTGGILTGQSLIRAAELRSVLVDFDKYRGAAMQFRNKYLYLPGDMPNANDFWPADIGNGNGDGKIDETGGWEMLSLAGLIEGSYQTGWGGHDTVICNSTGEVLGCTHPKSRISSAGYKIFYDAVYFLNKNYIAIGAISPSASGLLRAVLEVEEAWSIDKKVDDGLPSSGRLLGRKAHHSTGQDDCIYSNFSPGHSYIFASQGLACNIQMQLE